MARQGDRHQPWAAPQRRKLSLGQLIMKPVEDQFFNLKNHTLISCCKRRDAHAAVRKGPSCSSAPVGSTLSKPTFPCTVSTRAPSQLLTAPGPWQHGQIMRSLPQGPRSDSGPGGRSATGLRVCRGQKSCAGRLAGLNHGSIFISDLITACMC